jgi:hypothetical protein
MKTLFYVNASFSDNSSATTFRLSDRLPEISQLL